MPTGIVVYPADFSGNMPAFTPAGETIVNTSGQVIAIGGQGNNAVVTVDGSLQTQEQIPTQFIPTSLLICTSLSGGTRLTNQPVKRAVIRSHPANSGYMFLGSQNLPPFSGFGFVLAPGEAYASDITNTNVFRVYATMSGDLLTYAGTRL